jgi:quercetin dioxygenase-like cupin family protein
MPTSIRAVCCLPVVALLAATSITGPQESAVTARMNTYFAALGSGDTAALRSSVTGDFYMFEHARWTLDTLLALMPRAHGQQWALTNMHVTVANSMAYVTYENHGVTTPGLWLESAVLRREGGAWRIAFMHSTRMPLPSDPAPTVPAGLADWHPMGTNGASMMRLVGGTSPTELTAFRVRYPAGFKVDSGVHYHLGTEHVTVLKGTILVGFGDTADYTKMTAYGPGSFLVIPAGTHHYETMHGLVESHVEAIGPMTTVWITHAGP